MDRGEAHSTAAKRIGKVPPVDAFSSEEPDVLLDDWHPGLQRAAQWNDLRTEELLIQLAGHLRG